MDSDITTAVDSLGGVDRRSVVMPTPISLHAQILDPASPNEHYDAGT